MEEFRNFMIGRQSRMCELEAINNKVQHPFSKVMQLKGVYEYTKGGSK